tara:strand:+ start:260 stop:436 length:177 start_codon:yes stop_codon:yes gene_type:complete
MNSVAQMEKMKSILTKKEKKPRKKRQDEIFELPKKKKSKSRKKKNKMKVPIIVIRSRY